MTPDVPVLVARGVRHEFPGGVVALDGVDLELRPGEMLGLLGANGAGKSTLLRVLAGLLAPDAGSVQLRGVDIVRHAARVRGAVGVLPGEDDAPTHLTGREATVLVGRLHGLDDPTARSRTEDLLALLDVADRDRDRRIGTYSTGTRRKVLLACALVHAPDVLLLDEPLSGLDPAAAGVVGRVLADVVRGGRAVLFSSHAIDVVEQACDRLAVLHDGRLLACGDALSVRVAAQVAADAPLLDAYLALIGRGADAGAPEWLG